MTTPTNPMGREYSRAEIAAARRLGLARTEYHAVAGGQVEAHLSGPIIWATGPHHPNQARQNARDWTLIADAMDREWPKPLPSKEATR